MLLFPDPSFEKCCHRPTLGHLLVCAVLILFLHTAGCIRPPGQGLRSGEVEEKQYVYESGRLMRRDFHDRRGEVVRSQWYAPDGTQIAETSFRDGNGLEVYLHESGAIRSLIQYRSGEPSLLINFASDGLPTEVRLAGDDSEQETFVLDGSWTRKEVDE